MSFGTDRTADFLQAAHSLKPTSNGLDKVSVLRLPRSGSTPTQFAAFAALISNDLSVTCSRLESLSCLARQRTLFDDHSTEAQHLTLLIKEDIANLNHRIADLQTLLKQRRDLQLQQSAKHSSSVLMSLQTRLAGMSEKFKKVLEQRSDTLRAQSFRKNAFTAKKPMGRDNTGFEGEPSLSQVKPAVMMPSILLQDEQRARQAASGGDVVEGPVVDFAAEQHQMTVYQDQTSAYLSSRHDTVRTIEHTIVELGEIFQQLAKMVHEQEERVQRIDANVEESIAAVESGHSELLRYFRSVSSNRWLMFKVFAVLLAFFIFFVIFIV